jgi:hypothetical protein
MFTSGTQKRDAISEPLLPSSDVHPEDSVEYQFEGAGYYDRDNIYNEFSD